MSIILTPRSRTKLTRQKWDVGLREVRCDSDVSRFPFSLKFLNLLLGSRQEATISRSCPCISDYLNPALVFRDEPGLCHIDVLMICMEARTFFPLLSSILKNNMPEPWLITTTSFTSQFWELYAWHRKAELNHRRGIGRALRMSKMWKRLLKTEFARCIDCYVLLSATNDSCRAKTPKCLPHFMKTIRP